MPKKTNEKVSKKAYPAPKKIWLQLYDEDGSYCPEPTWCPDKINDNDLCYKLTAQIEELKEKE